jgi:hypothetical protein
VLEKTNQSCLNISSKNKFFNQTYLKKIINKTKSEIIDSYKTQFIYGSKNNRGDKKNTANYHAK